MDIDHGASNGVVLDAWGLPYGVPAEDGCCKKQPQRTVRLCFHSDKFTPRAYTVLSILTGSLLLCASLLLVLLPGIALFEAVSQAIGDLTERFFGQGVSVPSAAELFSGKLHDESTLLAGGLLLMPFFLIIPIALTVKLIKCIASLAREGHRMQFGPVTGALSLFFIMLFFAEVFGSEGLLRAASAGIPAAIAAAALIAVYAVLRLLEADIAQRKLSFAFSCAACVLSIVMFFCPIGDLASFEISVLPELIFDLSELCTYEYMLGTLTPTGTAEAMLFENSVFSNSFPAPIAVVFFFILQLIAVLTSDVLPIAALSLTGYFVYSMTEPHYMQYYYLKCAKRAAVVMLTACAASILSVVLLYIESMLASSFVSVKLNIPAMILTVCLYAVMLVLVWLPWRAYKKQYARRCAEYELTKGGRTA